MAFKRHDWNNFKFSRNNGRISGEINITDGGKKVDRMFFNDNEGYRRVLKVMRKYGFEPEVDIQKMFNREEVNEVIKLQEKESEKNEKKNDIDWFKKGDW